MSGSAAVVLAAGGGLRLRPRTDEIPKALVPVAGKPILQHIAEALRDGAGVKNISIVTGYRAEDFKAIVPPSGCKFDFVHNPDWGKTNSGASLALAAETLAGGGYIVEGDCCFGAEFFRGAPSSGDDSLWFARPLTSADDGCCLCADDSGRIQSLMIRSGVAGNSASGWKSCGVVRLSAAVGANLATWLKPARHERAKEYYDLFLAEHLNAASFRIAAIGSAPWQEVDNCDDLTKAEALFHKV